MMTTPILMIFKYNILSYLHSVSIKNTSNKLEVSCLQDMLTKSIDNINLYLKYTRKYINLQGDDYF